MVHYGHGPVITHGGALFPVCPMGLGRSGGIRRIGPPSPAAGEDGGMTATYTDQDIYIDNGALLRPIPAASGLIKNWPDRPTPIGWTPPFWKPSLFELGWRTGTVLSQPKFTDFFTAIDTI